MLLSLRDIHVSYGGIQAVKGVNLEVAAGELVTLIGANGAGKTTVLKAIVGLLSSARGSVEYKGQNILGMPTHQIASQGIALVPEGRGIFPRLTIQENLRMGAYLRADQRSVRDDIEQQFALFPRLKERAQQTAGTLSGGEQQMLAIARALMARPTLLLLDEPSMGLAPIVVQKIFEVISDIAQKGMTILLIEQNATLALQISRRGYVMESGRILFADDAQGLLANPKVREAYLGEILPEGRQGA